MTEKKAGFFQEMKRRHVFRVAAAYVVIAWLIVEVADILLETFSAPDWVMKTFITLLALGFPVALVLAWAFELTSDGLKLDIETTDNGSSPKSKDKGKARSKGHDASIVVLPLDLIGKSADEDYIAEGLTEDLTTLLSRSPGMFVIARNTSYTYRDSNLPVREIAEELGVRYVVEGSVRRMGENLRVNIQLIEADSEDHLWAQRFDFPESELFSAQEDICARISTQLAGSLSEAEAQRAERTPAGEVDAWLLTRKAFHTYFGAVDKEESVREAWDLIQRALEIDPNYPHALAFHAHQCTTSIIRGYLKGDLQERRELAFKQIRAALKIAPNDPMVLWCWGVVQGFLGSGEGAVKTLRRAMELNPNDPHIAADLGYFLANAGEADEGVELIRRAFRLSPHEPRTFIWHFYLGQILARIDMEEAIKEFRASAALLENYEPSLLALIICFSLLGREQEAQQTAARLRRAHPQIDLENVRQIYALGVNDDELRKLYLDTLAPYLEEKHS